MSLNDVDSNAVDLNVCWGLKYASSSRNMHSIPTKQKQQQQNKSTFLLL